MINALVSSRRGWQGLLLFLLGWWCMAGALAQAPIPPLTARVVDTTQTFTAAQVAELSSRLAALERETGAQLAILVVPTTEGEPIESYAVKVFEDWKLGRKGVDDGVLLVVAKDDRALRIEVGYGLEGAVTDVQSGRIIREYIVPKFAADDYAGGVEAGVAALEALVRKEPLPEPVAGVNEDWEQDWPYAAFFGLVFLLMASPIVATPLGALVGWLMGGVLGAVIGGVLAFAVTALLGVLGIRKRLHAAARKGGGGGWGGPGGGWGGGSGGGWGGGGGRSGGGGASGRW